jgi:hypothetical protein
MSRVPGKLAAYRVRLVPPARERDGREETAGASAKDDDASHRR